MSVRIRSALAEDREDWLGLWQGYLAFYEQVLDPKVTDMTWHRILDPMSPVSCFMAVRNLDVAGFAIIHRQTSTWSIGPVLYLEDLFVDPQFRGEGIGGALIDFLIETGKAEGASELYWQTREGNAKARSLYDVYAKANDFVTYRVPLQP